MSRHSRARYGYGYGVDDRDYGYGYTYGGYGYGAGDAMDTYGGGIQDAYADYYNSGEAGGADPQAEEELGGYERRNIDPYHDDTPLRNRSRSRSPPRRAYHSTTKPYLPRTPSPPSSSLPSSQPQEPEPKQTSPSKTYLRTSLTPSHPLPSPTDSRKLLILDLNGTLLIRAARHVGPNSARYKYQNQNRSRYTPNSNSAPPAYTQGRLRPVSPRPYMPTLRAYLFHKETKKWLDTMVWSSAQPHSVKDMVGKCFGEGDVVPSREDGEGDTGGLVAVWTRDMMGLSQDDYSESSFPYFFCPASPSLFSFCLSFPFVHVFFIHITPPSSSSSILFIVYPHMLSFKPFVSLIHVTPFLFLFTLHSLPFTISPSRLLSTLIPAERARNCMRALCRYGA